MKRIRVLTHARPELTAWALDKLLDVAKAGRAVLYFDEEEGAKHRIIATDWMQVGPVEAGSVDLCFVLGGDGTILKALRLQAGTDVPVFAVNFGEIGFLATVEQDELEQSIDRALSGSFELLRLPAIVLEGAGERQLAINDVAIHRRTGDRVASLSYAFDGEELGSVRCDGLVVATPAGSTGYNLANGGPVMAWGVAGFVVSFIAPHSLTARALVVAPRDSMRIHSHSPNPLDVSLDGRPVGELPAGSALFVTFLDEACALAQLPGTSFYRRLGEKFGRLAR